MKAGVVTVAVVLAIAVAGVAVAYYVGVGTGSGSAATRTPASVVTLGPGTTTGTVYPASSANGTVVVQATNADDGTVRIGSLQLDTTKGTAGFAVDAAHSGCPTSSLTYTSQTNGGNGWSIDGGQTVTLTLPSSLRLTTTAPNACQGATFTVHLKVAS